MVGIALLGLTFSANAEQPLPPPRPSLNLFGMTGLIDMPSAEMQPDAQLSVTSGFFGGYLRNTISAQILPWMEVGFRYSVLDDFFVGPGDTTLYDRSLDLKLRMIEEGPGWPSLAIGLQDFLGTGIYSGEYLAATKTFIGGDLKVTGGIGWGRFSGRSGIGNPLCRNGNSFCTRPPFSDEGGTVEFDEFFSGREMGIFGGAEWQTPIENVALKLEYSDDPYDAERASGAFDPELGLNFGAEYRPFDGVELGAYYMYGAEVGVRLTLSANPFRPLADTDGERPAEPFQARPRPDASALEPDFGKLREPVTGSPATVRFAASGITDVTVEMRDGNARWATAGLPPSADHVCPDEKARAIDAEYGMIDAVTFLLADGRPLCTVALRPKGQNLLRDAIAGTADYPTDWYQNEHARQQIATALAKRLEPDAIGLFGIELKPERVSVYIENRRFRSTPRAIGRTVRALAAAMPASVELFEIIPVENSLPVVSIMLRRSHLEDQVHRPEADWSAWVSARLTDTSPVSWSEIGTLEQFPRAYWSLSPYTPFSLFDPDQPFRIDLQAVAQGGVEIFPGFSANATVSKRIVGNLDDIERESDSELPRVRSDIAEYLRKGDPGLQRLTLDYVTKLDDAVYGRVSTGLLEWMYGGVSGEVLWKPATQNWGLGAEMNWVQQRGFDQDFSFRDYDVFTGHASLYWDTGWQGIAAQIDAGRYLAKDWGATFTLKRRFSNGWELGGYATFTDVSSSDFGEGSFDKGILLTIPFDWLLPYESRSEYSVVLGSLTKDGGQRLLVSNRLYPTVRDMDADGLRRSWQDFWK